MRLKTILSVGLLLAGLAATAQQAPLIYSGKVLDGVGDAVPYATFYSKALKSGWVADEEGKFLIKIADSLTNDTIVVSAIGYESVDLVPANLPHFSDVEVRLPSKTYRIGLVEVSANAGEQLIRAVIDKIPQHFSLRPYTLDAFYRQYHIEDDKPVRLIEAAINLFDPGYHKGGGGILAEKINIKQLRRSNVTEQNQSQHGDHLPDLLLQNVVHYRTNTFLHANAVSAYKLELDTISPGFDFDKVACVKFLYRDDAHPRVEEGRIFIRRSDTSVVRISTSFYLNKQYRERYGESGLHYDWLFQDGTKVIDFKRKGNKYYLDHIYYEYKHFLVDPSFRTMEHVVEEHFELWTGNDLQMMDNDYPGRGYHKMAGLYSKPYDHDPAFWEQYPLLQQHPTPLELVGELSQRLPLEEQFKKNGR